MIRPIYIAVQNRALIGERITLYRQDTNGTSTIRSVGGSSTPLESVTAGYDLEPSGEPERNGPYTTWYLRERA